VRLTYCGSDRVERVLLLTGYVNADAGFTDEHLVINGASQLVREAFGEVGRHARTAMPEQLWEWRSCRLVRLLR
jgi:hypothetical protein